MDYVSTVLVVIGINLIAALGLYIITGLTGQFSLGHAGFMSIGAYVSTILNMQYQVNFWVALVIAMVVSGVIGWLLSYPTTKLRGDYLALVTIGFGEIIRVLLLNMDITNGALGISGIPSVTNLYNVYAVVIVGLLFVQLLKKSWFGKGLIAIRENEGAATVMGIDVANYKRISFAIGTMFAACSGIFYAYFISFISPGDFGLSLSIQILLFLIVGGLLYVRGVIIGTVVMTLLPEVLRFVQDYRSIVYGIMLILLMIFRPDGIVGGLSSSKKLQGLWRLRRQGGIALDTKNK